MRVLVKYVVPGYLGDTIKVNTRRRVEECKDELSQIGRGCLTVRMQACGVDACVYTGHRFHMDGVGSPRE